MSAADEWQPMSSAPKDGSRILVVIRAGEQGPADVDVVRWVTPKRNADPCWTSTDSTHDCTIVYEDWEASFWMALPTSLPPVKTAGLIARLPVIPSGDEIGGSGI